MCIRDRYQRRVHGQIKQYQTIKIKKYLIGQNSQQIMSFSTSTDEKLKEIETFLNSNNYLSSGVHPNYIDIEIFDSLKTIPDQSKYPNLFHWYGFLYNFTAATRKGWLDAKPKEVPKVEKKEEAKKEVAQEEEDDDDLFGEETEEDKLKQEELQKKKKEEANAKKKEKPAAKSVIIFDVKVYDTETDLPTLAKRIMKEIKIEGLVWNKEVKILPVAYDIKKLQLGCIVEDEKVGQDDIFDVIQEWEEVQSCDIVSFQKN
eukprot:TRINITY_DN93_c0_g2_i1.p1 TRINITY_DN93_c0_g2~~TRINITY_DN93_c0_g2_i1.p1  ORF type:complete len:275 (+),score=69.25 TRINITY_DN93_c0_g2_i1:51-827(+)